MRAWSPLIALACLLAGCGGSSADSSCNSSTLPPRADVPHTTLTKDDKAVWQPLPADRSSVPILVYHGIGPKGDFTDSADADSGIDQPDFVKQMRLIKRAGYQTISLAQFADFVSGEKVDLPPRPLLLTFDDGRRDSWTGADEILQELGWGAVLFVDTGRVDRCDPEYLTWGQLAEIAKDRRWELQPHAGPEGHTYIKVGPDKDDTGAFYAYRKESEAFDAWRTRARSDVEEADKALADHIDGFRARAFALPFGTYGQDGTNDSRIPGDLMGWLSERYSDVFTLENNDHARAGDSQPLGRIGVTRTTTGGELHSQLVGAGN